MYFLFKLIKPYSFFVMIMAFSASLFNIQAQATDAICDASRTHEFNNPIAWDVSIVFQNGITYCSDEHFSAVSAVDNDGYPFALGGEDSGNPKAYVYWHDSAQVYNFRVDSVAVPNRTKTYLGAGSHTITFNHTVYGAFETTFTLDGNGEYITSNSFTLLNLPFITGGASAVVNMARNQTAVTDLTTLDHDTEGAGLTYSLSGGADMAQFSVDATTGVLAFLSAPDYNNPKDVGADSVYNVQVMVTDSDAHASVQDIAVTVGMSVTLPAANATLKLIKDFATKRNELLLNHRPSSSRRIGRLNGGGNNPLPINVEVSENILAFTTSTNRLAALGQAIDNTQNINALDIWTSGNISKFADGASAGHFGVLYGGVDMLLSENLLLGFMGEYDWMKQNYNIGGKTISGKGFMFEPYATVKLTDNFYVDGSTSWGITSNSISPIGTYTDKFTTHRWYIGGALIGEFSLDKWTISPSIALQYISDKQLAYTDSLNVAIPTQTIAQGDIRFDPKISYQHKLADGSILTPWFSAAGIYGFGADKGFSATISGGVDLQIINGITLSLAADYGGIGKAGYDYGGSVGLNIPLN